MASMSLHMQEAAREGALEIALTEAERDARVELAACYRIFDMLGWTEMIFNHITLRVPVGTLVRDQETGGLVADLA